MLEYVSEIVRKKYYEEIATAKYGERKRKKSGGGKSSELRRNDELKRQLEAESGVQLVK